MEVPLNGRCPYYPIMSIMSSIMSKNKGGKVCEDGKANVSLQTIFSIMTQFPE
ncbi:MAG: hypothetical protein SCARUB_02263 [Candidatus Scalindua rubra]|uniref:Uncharacterized protein n=1 Tax=Candidatus Scalindua rubra TaxID=1872076 RepID=A0A1E3XAF2_9BACT|nr:MAG: hypothetical protein SCARUB_02263 [Candidatus Scalindua rubra]